MKKFFFLYVLLFFSILSFPQEIVKNGLLPQHPNSDMGRVVNLKQVFSIKDNGEEYFFRSPFGLKVAPDGGVFIMDNKEFLQFDSKGNFIRNYFHYGLGPSEMTFPSGYQIYKDEIIFFNMSPNKLIWFDKNGNFKKEKRISFNQDLEFLFSNGEIFIFKSQAPPIIKSDLSIIDTQEKFLSISSEGDVVKDRLYEYTSKVFVGRFSENNYSKINASPFLYCENDLNSIYFSNSQTYEINRFDVVTGKITMKIIRNYKRVKTSKEDEKFFIKGGIFFNGKMHRPPIQEYIDDILGLFKVKSNLWVVTSTVNPEKGIQIDVINEKGKFVDFFYLKLPEHISPYYLIKNEYVIQDGLFILIERDKDYNFSIVSYRIEMPKP